MDVLLEVLSLKISDDDCGWFLAFSNPPVLSENEYGYPMSVPVFGYFQDGSRRVVYAFKYDEDSPLRWKTDCSEGWEVTSKITHWMPLPPPPKMKYVDGKGV